MNHQQRGQFSKKMKNEGNFKDFVDVDKNKMVHDMISGQELIEMVHDNGNVDEDDDEKMEDDSPVDIVPSKSEIIRAAEFVTRWIRWAARNDADFDLIDRLNLFVTETAASPAPKHQKSIKEWLK